jgi:hypothetical protein
MHLLTFWAFWPVSVRLLKGVAISQQVYRHSSRSCTAALAHHKVLHREPCPIDRTDSPVSRESLAEAIRGNVDNKTNVEGADVKRLTNGAR